MTKNDQQMIQTYRKSFLLIREVILMKKSKYLERILKCMRSCLVRFLGTIELFPLEWECVLDG